MMPRMSPPLLMSRMSPPLVLLLVAALVPRSGAEFPALVYTDASQPSPSRFTTPPHNFTGNNGRLDTFLCEISIIIMNNDSHSRPPKEHNAM